jgi:hypothetical protein
MDRDLTDRQNMDLERLIPIEDYGSFAEAKRAAVKEGLKVLLKRNGMKSGTA